MIICAQCGERNPDRTAFCGRCGAFLEWEGERLADPAAGQAGGAVEPGTPATSRDEPAPVDLDATEQSDPGGERNHPEEEVAVAVGPRESVVGAALPGVARQPGQMRRRRRPSPRPSLPRNVPTGSLICGSCGMPNQSERRFCARCGHPLADARVVRKAPWWRRLLGRERIYQAGSRKAVRRPGRRLRGLRRVLTALVLLGCIGGVAVLAGPQRGLVVEASHWVQNQLQPPEQVRPTGWSASASVKAHPASYAFDGAKNTFWAPPQVAGAATVPWVRAEFAEPIHLVRVGLTPGMSIETPLFVAGTRPAEVEVSVTTGTDQVVRRFKVPDSPGFREWKLDVRDARTVQVAVVASRGSHRTLRTALSEVEFWADR